LTIEVRDLRLRLIEGLHFNGLGRMARHRKPFQHQFLRFFGDKVLESLNVRFPIRNRARLRLTMPLNVADLLTRIFSLVPAAVDQASRSR
jgi:hypothetical protein